MHHWRGRWYFIRPSFAGFRKGNEGGESALDAASLLFMSCRGALCNEGIVSLSPKKNVEEENA